MKICTGWRLYKHRIRAMQVQGQGYVRLCRTQVRGSTNTGLGAVQHSHLCPQVVQYTSCLRVYKAAEQAAENKQAWESPRFNSLSYHHHLRVVGLFVCFKLKFDSQVLQGIGQEEPASARQKSLLRSSANHQKSGYRDRQFPYHIYEVPPRRYRFPHEV